MPRKNVNEMELQEASDEQKLQDLERVVTEYAKGKDELDSLKKVCDEQNKAIKSLMSTLIEPDNGKRIYEIGDIVCTVNQTKKESFNEDKLLDVLRLCPVEGLIKTREYVDMDVLEDAIYKQEIGQDLLMEIDSCREVKETQVLTIKRKKG